MLIVKNIILSRIIINTRYVDLIMIASCMGAYFIREYLIAHHFSISTIIPTVLGTAIAFFICFNNNQAYDRWWEARKVWGGLVNDSRSFSRALLRDVPKGDENNEIVERMIRRHIAFLYALKANLRSTVDLIYVKYLDEEEQKEIETHNNLHNAILLKQSEDLERLSKSGAVDGFKFI